MSNRRDNSGTLGRNKRREKDTHPEFNGQCVIDGREYWINGWVKEGNDGGKFFSLSFKPKEQRGGGSQRPAPEPEDEEIPF